jgi:hypothetical protein
MCRLLFFGIGAAGNQGYFRLRPYMAEDRVLVSLLVLFWGGPVITHFLYVIVSNTKQDI